MSASTHLLLTLELCLEALVVTIVAGNGSIDLGLGEGRVGLTRGLDNDARLQNIDQLDECKRRCKSTHIVEILVRGDGVVAAEVMAGGVRDDKVLESSGGDGVVVVGVSPASEARDWVVIPNSTVLNVIGIKRPVPVGLGAIKGALGLERLFKLVGVPPIGNIKRVFGTLKQVETRLCQGRKRAVPRKRRFKSTWR